MDRIESLVSSSLSPREIGIELGAAINVASQHSGRSRQEVGQILKGLADFFAGEGIILQQKRRR